MHVNSGLVLSTQPNGPLNRQSQVIYNYSRDDVHAIESIGISIDPKPKFSIELGFRKTFRLEDWTSHAWTQSPPDLELFAMFGGSLGYVNDIRSEIFHRIRDARNTRRVNREWKQATSRE